MQLIFITRDEFLIHDLIWMYIEIILWYLQTIIFLSRKIIKLLTTNYFIRKFMIMYLLNKD